MRGEPGKGGGRLSDLAGRIRSAQRQIAEATVATGRNLAFGRRLLAPPDWREWVGDLGWTPDTAEQLEQVAERFGQAALAEVVDLIAPGAMLALSPPSSAEAAAAAIALARRGQRVSYADALDLLARHCPEPSPE